jgi:hypothetical protein
LQATYLGFEHSKLVLVQGTQNSKLKTWTCT